MILYAFYGDQVIELDALPKHYIPGLPIPADVHIFIPNTLEGLQWGFFDYAFRFVQREDVPKKYRAMALLLT